jgi:histidine triad (HIT) family protein
MHDCVFCKILSGDVPAHFVYEDEKVAAFLSLEQPTPCKVLVVPREHVEMIFDLNDELAAAIFQATVREASGCSGLNLIQSNGRVGQQDIFHFHLHIVPRFEDDGIVLAWDTTQASLESLQTYAQQIREQLA